MDEAAKLIVADSERRGMVPDVFHVVVQATLNPYNWGDSLASKYALLLITPQRAQTSECALTDCERCKHGRLGGCEGGGGRETASSQRRQVLLALLRLGPRAA